MEFAAMVPKRVCRNRIRVLVKRWSGVENKCSAGEACCDSLQRVLLLLIQRDTQVGTFYTLVADLFARSGSPFRALHLEKEIQTEVWKTTTSSAPKPTSWPPIPRECGSAERREAMEMEQPWIFEVQGVVNTDMAFEDLARSPDSRIQRRKLVVQRSFVLALLEFR